MTNSWINLAGNEYNGVLNGGLAWESDTLIFDGVDDWVSIGKINYPNITMEMVISVDDNNVANVPYFANWQSGGYGWAMNVDGKNVFEVYTDNYHGITANSEILSNKKYSLSGSYNNSVFRIFENGEKDLNGTITYPENTILVLGADPKEDTVQASAGFFKGKIYSVRFYNRALTDNEVLTNYEIDKKRFK